VLGGGGRSTNLQQQSSANAISLIGERFFANRTGLGYFDDGTARLFTHTLAPESGSYYDNSTAFVAGNVPGIGLVVEAIKTTSKTATYLP
jgi:hypothetical protein